MRAILRWRSGLLVRLRIVIRFLIIVRQKITYGAPRRDALNAGRPSSRYSLETMRFWDASLQQLNF